MTLNERGTYLFPQLSVQNQDRPFIIINCFIHGTLEMCACQRSFVIPMTERNFSNPAAPALGGGAAWGGWGKGTKTTAAFLQKLAGGEWAQPTAQSHIARAWPGDV